MATRKKKTDDAPAEALEGAFKNRIRSLEYLPASELGMHPKNWRLHPDEQRSALTGVLETIGVADAVIAYHSERAHGQLTLIDGHLRRELLDQPIPVLVTDLDDAEADALLASHDAITTMAITDEKELARLLEDIAGSLPREVIIAIDPDLDGSLGELVAEAGPDAVKPRYDIVPQLDEGYDAVMIFAMREPEISWLRTVLKLPTKQSKNGSGNVGVSQVLTVAEFQDRWFNRGEAPPVDAPELDDAPPA